MSVATDLASLFANGCQ